MAGVTKKRPTKDKLLEAALRRELVQNPEDALMMAKAMIALAKTGNINAFTAIRDTVDGKPHQSIDMDVDMRSEEIKTVNEADILDAFRKRMAGIIPERSTAGVDGARESGSGGDQKPH